MVTVLRNIIAVVMLCAVIYLVSNYYDLAQETVGVKGVSTDKAQEIQEDIQSDLGKQADAAAENANALTVGEIIGFFGRFQKIPEDINNAREYAEEQIGNLTNKEK
jgi:hypothetical protein